jgi:hypothetical protein
MDCQTNGELFFFFTMSVELMEVLSMTSLQNVLFRAW